MPKQSISVRPLRRYITLFLLIMPLAGACVPVENIRVETQEPVATHMVTIVPSATQALGSALVQVTASATAGPDIGSTLMSDKDGVVLVYVPAGTFTMGSQDLSSTGASPHSITLDAFWIDQTEVTNKQYALCVAEGRCTLPSDLKSPRRSSYYMDLAFAAYPVIYVEWAQAEAYCKWAGRQLPTEAQWEKAARGTDGRMYPWGDAAPHDTLLNYNSTSRDTTQVKSYPDGVSVYGAYDMAGNVWEWVHDLYDDNYYQYSPSLNPLGPNEPGVYTPLARSLRGGSWYYEEGSPRSIFRYGVVPVEYLVRSDVRSWAVARYQDTSVYGRPPLGFGTVGFRCAMNVTP